MKKKIDEIKKGKNSTSKTTDTSTSSSTTGSTSMTSTTMTVSQVKQQIKDTYTKAKKWANRSSFDGWCGAYVRAQLGVLGIIAKDKDTDCSGNGCVFTKNVNASKKTSTGYTKTKFSGGAKCLTNISKKYNGNITNIVISYPHSSKGNYTTGHVVFIHAIINGTVYYSECYTKNGYIAGTLRTKTVSAFDAAYTKTYGNAVGAVWFHK